MGEQVLVLDARRDIVRVNNEAWFYYINQSAAAQLDEHKCGKWMHFFSDTTFAEAICKEAILNEVCAECKHTSQERMVYEDSGVICFYLNGDDTEGHKRVIRFMLDHELIRRTKTGKLYNIGFKFDDQTRAGEYGSVFAAAIKLDTFVNLSTGELLS